MLKTKTKNAKLTQRQSQDEFYMFDLCFRCSCHTQRYVVVAGVGGTTRTRPRRCSLVTVRLHVNSDTIRQQKFYVCFPWPLPPSGHPGDAYRRRCVATVCVASCHNLPGHSNSNHPIRRQQVGWSPSRLPRPARRPVTSPNGPKPAFPNSPQNSTRQAPGMASPEPCHSRSTARLTRKVRGVTLDSFPNLSP